MSSLNPLNNLLTAKERRALYVRIGMADDPSSIKQIPRFRLNPTNINRVFNCDIEFLQEDATGNIVWPKNWVTDCLPPPYIYFIREKVWPELDPDALELEDYRGRTLVVAENVPTEVTEKVLIAWLNAGLDDDDPDIASAKMQLDELRENLNRVEKQIAELPSLKVQGTNAADELEMKKKRAQALGLQRNDITEAIRELQMRFDILRKNREANVDLMFQVKLAEKKPPLQLGVWEIRFSQEQKGQKLAYIAVHKFNWSEFRVAQHRITQQVVTGKLELPDLDPDFVEINMRNVTVSRRQHGTGLYRFSDERGLYSGRWRHGLRHGTGTEVNALGRFQGTFENDHRRGPGTQVYSQGDLYRGKYGHAKFHLRESLLMGDEYCDGVPHGRGRAVFSDGSIYDGEWFNGLPSGKGRSISHSGLVLDGFIGVWGLLDGYGSQSFGEVTRIGRWRNGMLEGEGTEIDAAAGTYEGFFSEGQWSGFGKVTMDAIDGEYRGWFRQGRRWGRGVLNFGNLGKDAQRSSARKEALRKRAAAFLRLHDHAAGGFRSAVDVAAGLASPQEVARFTSVFEASQLDPEDVRAAFVRLDGKTVRSEERERALAALRGGSDASQPSGSENQAQESVAVPETNPLDDTEGRVNFIPYRGDFAYEGRWRAGRVRAGGVFTRRHGRAEPSMHTRALTHGGVNLSFPVLSELPEKEMELEKSRILARQSAIKETVDKRLIQEEKTQASFRYWLEFARAQRKAVRRRTRRTKVDLENVKASLRNPNDRDSPHEHSENDSDDETYEDDEHPDGEYISDQE